jgi:hypothetical protein
METQKCRQGEQSNKECWDCSKQNRRAWMVRETENETLANIISTNKT